MDLLKNLAHSASRMPISSKYLMEFISLQVKNKKRWSQVMYMSYVLDYQQNRLKGEKCNTTKYRPM